MMFNDFLSHPYTTALCDKDFTEWHQGIPYYGFWAILIEDPDYLALLSTAQDHLQHFFLPGYSRQAHITLNACGLISEAHFSQVKLDHQVSLLKNMNLSPFNISLSHVNSFSTAAYVGISNTNRALWDINKGLSSIISDSIPESYIPHTTLGLYRDRFESKGVVKEIMKFGDLKVPALLVNEIQFCRYKTENIQGPIEVIQRFHF